MHGGMIAATMHTLQLLAFRRRKAPCTLRVASTK
jgi:hypothetical protein